MWEKEDLERAEIGSDMDVLEPDVTPRSWAVV